jgi:hypothetical protein
MFTRNEDCFVKEWCHNETFAVWDNGLSLMFAPRCILLYKF